MALIDPNNFLHSLVRWMVARAQAIGGPAIEWRKTPRGIWEHEAVEGLATDPYSTVLLYQLGGRSQATDPLPRAAVQVKSYSRHNAESLNRSWLLYSTGLDAAGRQVSMVTIDGYTTADAPDGHWVLVSVEPLQRPGRIGRDRNGWVESGFNLDVGFYKKD